MEPHNLTISADPFHRFWLELTNDNPFLVEQFRPVLTGFIAFDRYRNPALAGTGFVIAATSDMAVAITAKHVLTEGVARHQKPNTGYAASTPFSPTNAHHPMLGPEYIKASWAGTEHAKMLDVHYACFNESTDVACCFLTPQGTERLPMIPMSVPIHSSEPHVGQTVHMVSLDRLSIEELEPPKTRDGVGQVFSFNRSVSVRIGTVTGVFRNGYRQYRWPCFTTSIPAEPGMSGGLVFVPEDKKTIAACGVVCADNSAEEARQNNYKCGESVIAMAWTGLALRLPIHTPVTPDVPTESILNMMKNGYMDAAIGGIDQFAMQEHPNGDYTITRKD